MDEIRDLSQKTSFSRRDALRQVAGWATSAGLMVALEACVPSNPFTPTAAPISAKIGAVPELNMGSVPLLVAQDQGFFDQAGIQVERTGMDATVMPAAITNGSIDFAYAGVTGTMMNLAQTGKIVAFCRAVWQNPNLLIISKRFIQSKGIDVNANAADKLKALKGCTFATSGPNTGSEITVRYLLGSAGYQPGQDYTIVDLKSLSAFAATMQQGLVDGFAAFSPIGEAAIQSGAGVKYLGPESGIEAFKGMPWNTLWGRTDAIGSSTDKFQRSVAGMWQALTFIRTQPDKAKALVRKEFANLDDGTFSQSWDNNFGIFAPDPFFDESGFQKSIALQNFSGASKITAPSSQLFTNSITDAVKNQGHF